MTLTVEHQPTYSRGELLLRTLFGWLYIGIPHMIALAFVLLVSQILTFFAFWAILFTGSYPRGMYNFNLGAMRWQARLTASLTNLVDGYPEFGLKDGQKVHVEAAYPENVSRGSALVRFLFGFVYILIPHSVVLLFRTLVGVVLQFLAWWAVLFTGSYPESWHQFNVGTMRWSTRVSAHMAYMTDAYPKFSGKP